MTYVTTSSMMFDVSNNLFLQFPSRLCQLVRRNRASDISRGRGPAKFRYFREIPRNPPEIFPNTCRQNIFNTYLGYYTGFIHPKRPNLA